MCYSTALRKGKEEIEEKLRATLNSTFSDNDSYEPYFHLNGFTHGNLFIIKMDDTKNIYPASWGLIPDWSKSSPAAFRQKSNTLNARGESIFTKVSFKKSAFYKRCLILADGFFEPHHVNGTSIPYFCYQPSKTHSKGDLFLFAGLYNELDDNIYSATILTVKANNFFAEVHNKKKRMPLILDAVNYTSWLDNKMSEQMIKQLIEKGFTKKKFEAHPVSRDLYRKGVNTNKPYIIDEVQKDTLF